MKLKANKYDLKQNFNGDIELTLHISKESYYTAKQIQKDDKLQGELSIEIKKYSKHRTLNQNDFLWALETKLADYYNKSVNEIHRTNLIAYGVPYGQAVMKYELAEDYCKTNYARIEKEKTERGVRVALFTIYKGSSQMNTREFTRLVDGIIAECKSCEIDIEYDKADFTNLINQMQRKENETQKK